MGSEAHLSTLLLSRPDRRTRPARWLLLIGRRIADRLPQRFYLRGTQIAIDCSMAACGVLLAYQLRFDFNVPGRYAQGMWFWFLTMGIVRPATLLAFGIYQVRWRWIHLRDLTSLILASVPASLLLLSLRLTLRQTAWAADVPIGVIVLELATFVGLASSVRGLRRLLHEESKSLPARRKRALLLGSEESLAAAVSQCRALPELDIVGLISPSKHLQGFRIRRVPVLGQPAQLSLLLAKSMAEALVIADANSESTAAARNTTAALGVKVHLLPSASDVIRGQVRVTTPLDPNSLFESKAASGGIAGRVLETYRNRVVLVTGAGGSIGSELSKQVSRLGISRLLLLDRDENAIFEAHHELNGTRNQAVPLVGDIREKDLLRRIFIDHSPDIVLHAAAFKHVPIMESNASEAVLNNVQGTRVLAQVAQEFGSERFVMISSDKAVQPASVIGATKRIAEMVVQSRARQSKRTRFASVRFGNVLGSRGSVVPIFLKQIANGQPITITDERMSRYFMTIKDAVRLVLQASSLAFQGEIYALDMGEPVKITHLVRKLTEMSGLDPAADVTLETIGIRPGEKLHEQLWHEGLQISLTEFAGLYSVQAENIPAGFPESVAELEQIAQSRNDCAVLQKLGSMPVGYSPGPHRAATVD